MQEGYPLKLTSRHLCDKNLGKPTYEKEIMVIIHAVNTFHPYLIGRCIEINTNHHNLKYFLEQWLCSLEKHKWVTKMLGYDYDIIYKKGKENVVAIDLYRKFEEEGSLFAMSLPSLGWLQEA
jgi:hypothetical protein